MNNHHPRSGERRRRRLQAIEWRDLSQSAVSRAGLALSSLALSIFLAATGLEAAGVDLFTRQPAQLRSANGKLDLDLVVKVTPTTLKSRHIHNLRTYNGAFPGPTLNLRPGDTLNIRHINRLPSVGTSGEHAGHFTAEGYNTLNLHTHGLNASPEGFSDNVLLEIKPGHWIPYSIHIPPDHPAGLFWYHPHKHGSTTLHVGSGLTGNLIVAGGEGDLDQIEEIRNAKSLEMIFNELPLEPIDQLHTVYQVVEHPMTSILPPLTIFTVNGLPVGEVELTAKQGTNGAMQVTSRKQNFLELPEIKIRPGEVQRWRFTHAGLVTFLRLAVVTNDLSVDITNRAALPLQLVAYDGITTAAAELRKLVFVGPANRVDLLVQGGAPGSYTLASLAQPLKGSTDDSAFASVASSYIPLATVTVAGDPMVMPLPSRLNPPVNRLPNIESAQVDRQRFISFLMSLPPELAGTNEERLTFTVNHKAFDAHRVDETMLFGSAEEWILHADHHSPHPFHIHVNWFQVLEINGVPLPYPRWQDTVTIPRDQTAKIRHRFERFTGKFVFHCHILRHEDTGMMSLVEVIDPKNFILGGEDAEDAEGDGFANFVHFAFGLAPSLFPALPVALPVGYPRVSWLSVDNQTYPAIQYNRRADVAAATINYWLESSTNLEDWQAVAQAFVGNPVPKGNGMETVVVRPVLPIGGAGSSQAQFYRVLAARKLFEASPIPPGFPE